jgi:hypothetical protein
MDRERSGIGLLRVHAVHDGIGVFGYRLDLYSCRLTIIHRVVVQCETKGKERTMNRKKRENRKRETTSSRTHAYHCELDGRHKEIL